jgi:hypothetical protein
VSNGGDIFGMINFGTPSPQPQAINNPQPVNNGFGGDLLGFGLSSPTQAPPPQPPAQVNNGFGNDLMGFGFSTGPSNPSPPAQPPAQTGFNFGLGSPQPQPVQSPQPQNNNFGFNLMGAQSISVQPPAQTPQTSTFQPLVNNNPNKILAYDNNHLQIWIDCIK